MYYFPMITVLAIIHLVGPVKPRTGMNKHELEMFSLSFYIIFRPDVCVLKKSKEYLLYICSYI